MGLRGRLVGVLLFALPLLLLVKASVSLWTGDAGMLAATVFAYGLFALGGLLTRRGVQQELVAAVRPTTARGLPLKSLAAAAVGAGAGFTAFGIVGHDVPAALAYAIGAAAGYLMLYGVDSRPDRLPAWAGGRAEADARTVLELAYQRLDALDAASRQIANREFRQRLGSISLVVSNILRAIEENPADVRRTRKFFNVYLEGAQKVTQQYARAEAHESSAEREHNFRTLLVDVENTCHQQYEKLLQHDALDLDVQIEVLTTRLRREGIA
ncbi:MAG: 5-bromo-4-chloroindolyl phosphate hydrolysis family protein [Rhodospirillales bacterium]